MTSIVVLYFYWSCDTSIYIIAVCVACFRNYFTCNPDTMLMWSPLMQNNLRTINEVRDTSAVVSWNWVLQNIPQRAAAGTHHVEKVNTYSKWWYCLMSWFHISCIEIGKSRWKIFPWLLPSFVFKMVYLKYVFQLINVPKSFVFVRNKISYAIILSEHAIH